MFGKMKRFVDNCLKSGFYFEGKLKDKGRKIKIWEIDEGY
jgi:hypothetical protein